MAKKYTLNVNKRGSRPRSERLCKLGAAVSDGGSTVVNVTSSDGSGDIYSHTHVNKSALDKITIDEESYLYVEQLRETEDGTEYTTCTEKVKAGFSDEAQHAEEASHADEAEHAKRADEAKHAEEADNAEKWDNHKFNDYLDQPVRKTDVVQHKEVISDTLRGAKQFVDGLLGSGYRLWQDDNGLVHLTLDKLTVRQTMVVLELLIERIRSVGGQIVVSAANGKIKTIEEQEGHYRITFEQENQFFPHDLIRCQVFAGGTTKGYWVEVADVVGDAVLVPKEEFEVAIPEVGDECVLMGNTENTERQNLILISATEDGQPRIDVMNGVKSKSFAGCLRGRFGSLEGINDDSFPTSKQPKGYGLYSDNAYLRGTFLLETGEDIKTKFEITEGKIQAAVTGIRQDFLGENGYLNNAAFADGMDKWTTENETVFFLVGNKWVWVNNSVLSKKGNSASVTTDNGRVVVRIRDKYILQKNGNLREKPEMHANAEGLKEPLPVYLSFYYRCAEPGTLKISFEGVDKTGFVEFDSLNVEEQLEATGDKYEQYTCNGLWNGTGDFKLSFSGDIYMYMLVLSTDKVEAFAYQYKTLFEQSDRLAKISAAVYDKDETALQETGLLVKPEGAGLYAQTADGKFALVGVCVDGKDADGNTISVVKLTGDNIKLEGVVTANETFRINENGTMECVGGKIGGFEIGEKSITAKESVLDLGVEDMQVRFQAISGADKTITINGGINEYAPYGYKVKYNENRRVTIPNKIPNSYNWENVHVVDVMDIEYYSMFTTPTYHFNNYGYQYAMLGNGHLCLDGIVEGHCLDVLKPFKAKKQILFIQMPWYCNRICVSSEYDDNVLVLPDLQSMCAAIGCGITRPESRRPFSFKMTFMNVGNKDLYVCGFATDAVNGEQALAINEFPKIYNKQTSYYSSLYSLKLSPYNVLEIMLVYDGTDYKALIV